MEAGLQPGGTGPSGARNLERRSGGACGARLALVLRADRAGGHALRSTYVVWSGAAPRLPIRPAALGRTARWADGGDQERPGKPRLPEPGEDPSGRMAIGPHLQHRRSDEDRAAGPLRRIRRDPVLLEPPAELHPDVQGGGDGRRREPAGSDDHAGQRVHAGGVGEREAAGGLRGAGQRGGSGGAGGRCGDSAGGRFCVRATTPSASPARTGPGRFRSTHRGSARARSRWRCKPKMRPRTSAASVADHGSGRQHGAREPCPSQSTEATSGATATTSTSAWTNPDEGDRAPITASRYRLCPVGRADCITDRRPGEVDHLANLSVPSAGEWQLSIWREDAAGNHQPANASVPVTLRYDPEPPDLGFEEPSVRRPDPDLRSRDRQGVGTGRRRDRTERPRLPGLADAPHPSGRQPVTRPDRRRSLPARYLRPASNRARPGNEPEQHREPPGRSPDDADLAAARKDLGPCRRPSDGAAPRSTATQASRPRPQGTCLVRPPGESGGRCPDARWTAARRRHRSGARTNGDLTRTGPRASSDRSARPLRVSDQGDCDHDLARRLSGLSYDPSVAARGIAVGARKFDHRHSPAPRGERPSGDLRRPSPLSAGARRGKARRVAGPALGALADLPDCPVRHERGLASPLPVQEELWPAPIPVPSAPTCRIGLPI